MQDTGVTAPEWKLTIPVQKGVREGKEQGGKNESFLKRSILVTRIIFSYFLKLQLSKFIHDVYTE